MLIAADAEDPENPVFIQKEIQLEKQETDRESFRRIVIDNFPQLMDHGNVYSLWELHGKDTTMVPMPENIDNAAALCDYPKLNRSRIYVRPVVSFFLTH